MHNAYTSKVNVWQVASAYLHDRKGTLSTDLFNNLLGSIRARDSEKMLNLPVNTSLHSQQEYITISQLAAFFSKNDSFADSERCFKNAADRFAEAELACKLTNKRLRYYARHTERDRFAAVKAAVRGELRRVMGDVEPFLDALPALVRVTSGSTSDSKRAKSLPYLKVRGTVTCTPGAVQLVNTFALHMGALVKLRMTETNRIVMVDKNSKTYRTIAAEPQGNLPFQLAIDSYLKTRLKRFWGVDLSSQERNRQLAYEGSINGNYATIDLKMASDMLSIAAVETLFPRKWVRLLHSLRSPAYKGVLGYGEYQKFSSMGNGYTFVLETALFGAVAKVLSDNFAVYGDDIIVDSACADSVIRVLRHLGFQANQEKTFLTGPFRESCGADFYNGTPVRPFFLRKVSNLTKTDVCHVVNGLFKIGSEGGKVWDLAFQFAKSIDAPLVPQDAASTAGIRIPTEIARAQGLIKVKGWVSLYKGFTETSVTDPVRELHGLKAMWFSLWKLESSRRDSPQVSGVVGPVSLIKVKRTYIPWSPLERDPKDDTHLYSLATWLGLDK